MTEKRNHSAIQRRLIPSYIFLIICALISVFPLFWMLTAATNTTLEVAQGKLWFGTNAAVNFKNLLNSADLWRSMWNSFFYATVQTVLCLLICSLAGYGFELYHTKGKDLLFGVLLLAMMIPGVATMIPLFTMMSRMKLLNTAWGFALPAIATPFMIMMFRQNSRNFPVEIMNAARIDGLSETGIFFKIYMPVMKSTYAAAAVITFMNKPRQRLHHRLRHADDGGSVLLAADDHHLLHPAEAVCRRHHRRGEISSPESVKSGPPPGRAFLKELL